MKLKFLGAAEEVGRSCIMVEYEGTRIIMDAGVKIGEEDAYPLLEAADIGSIDGVVISHAHLDHSAYLPHMVSNGYSKPIYSTKPTFELVGILVSDYLKISEPKDVSKDAMAKMLGQFKIVEYQKEFRIGSIGVRLLPAGHILGSAMIELTCGGERLLYSGDVNFRNTKLLEAGYTDNLDAGILVMESTYGGNGDTFPSEHATINGMMASIKETLSAGGKVIMPTFGVGRAQEMLLLLDDYMKSGLLPKAPIYMDGMVNKAMGIHRHNVVYCREELKNRILLNDDDPFKSKNFVKVETAKQRRGIISGEEPCIIVTTSGMLTGGPVLKYVKSLAKVPEDKIIFVGYQAEGTLGRELVNGAEEILIDESRVDVKFKVEKYHLSAHADRQQLLHFVSKVKNLKKVFIIHGERNKSMELKEAIGKRYAAEVPRLMEEVAI